MSLPPAPHIELQHGRLRSWETADADRLVTAWTDPDIARWNVVPPTPTRATAERWIAGEHQRLERHLAMDLVIDIDEIGVVGEVGLSGFSTPGFRDSSKGALVGYWLLPEARGRGIASEALRELCAWAHHVLDLDVIVARCATANVASHAVTRRTGFRHEADDADGNQLWRHYRDPSR